MRRISIWVSSRWQRMPKFLRRRRLQTSVILLSSRRIQSSITRRHSRLQKMICSSSCSRNFQASKSVLTVPSPQTARPSRRLPLTERHSSLMTLSLLQRIFLQRSSRKSRWSRRSQIRQCLQVSMTEKKRQSLTSSCVRVWPKDGSEISWEVADTMCQAPALI